MKLVNRSDIEDRGYRDILERESHHDHPIYRDDYGTLRWVPNKSIDGFLANISLNDLLPLLVALGYDKNSEVYRKLYRDMGYSFSGYWEIFYWEANNDKADEYTSPNLK